MNLSILRNRNKLTYREDLWGVGVGQEWTENLGCADAKYYI